MQYGISYPTFWGVALPPSSSSYYFGTKLFNHLPSNIKELACRIKRFRVTLSAFLHTKYFYTLDEYFKNILIKDSFA
jgi:hypothetical protein